MALGDDSTLAAHLRMIPDPRKKKGKQFHWWHLGPGPSPAVNNCGVSGLARGAASNVCLRRCAIMPPIPTWPGLPWEPLFLDTPLDPHIFISLTNG